jgi:flagella basal body P-ring formation protein FlgA
VATRLRGIALGYAPDVGRLRELSRERIQLAVQAAGFAAGTVEMISPAVARIRRASQKIDPDRVREAVERVVLKDLRAIGATARVARFDAPPVMEAPAGEIEIRAQASGIRDLFAPFISTVEIWQSGRVVERYSITTEVEAHALVCVAARDLPANIRFSRDDAVLEIRRLERTPSLYLRDADRLRGMYPRRSLARGEIITADLLVSDLVVKPGDHVRIQTQSDRLQISAAGEARAAGRVGDRISVRNKQSGLVLQATIVDEGLVRVNY